MLTGLVYDETGHRMCPTHANKKGRRYRYYISKRLIHRTDQTDGGWRLPARELEGAVTRAIGDFLRDGIRVVDALELTGMDPDRLRTVLHRAAAAARDIGDEQREHQIQLLRRLLHRVTLHPGSIHIELSRSGLASLTLEKNCDSAAHQEGLIDLTVPAALKRRGVEAKLIVSARSEVAAPDESLIALLSKAHRWRGQLAAGEVSSARQIARDDGISPSEVSRTIRLAFLAPDIVKAVLDGRQPIELTPRRLMRIGELPLEWHRQRHLLGFPA